MFITTEELDKRLKANTNLSNILERDKKSSVEKDIDRVLEGVIINRDGEGRRALGRKGKDKGDENVPQMFREIIAAQAQFGSGAEIAKKWGVSEQEVSNLKHGIPHRSNPDSPSNKGVQSVIEAVTGRIRDRICEKIELALDEMTPEKFENEQSLKTLTLITANLARTQQALESKDKRAEIDNRVQTIIYAPQTAEIGTYAIQEVTR